MVGNAHLAWWLVLMVVKMLIEVMVDLTCMVGIPFK